MADRAPLASPYRPKVDMPIEIPRFWPAFHISPIPRTDSRPRSQRREQHRLPWSAARGGGCCASIRFDGMHLPDHARTADRRARSPASSSVGNSLDDRAAWPRPLPVRISRFNDQISPGGSVCPVAVDRRATSFGRLRHSSRRAAPRPACAAHRVEMHGCSRIHVGFAVGVLAVSAGRNGEEVIDYTWSGVELPGSAAGRRAPHLRLGSDRLLRLVPAHPVRPST